MGGKKGPKHPAVDDDASISTKAERKNEMPGTWCVAHMKTY